MKIRSAGRTIESTGNFLTLVWQDSGTGLEHASLNFLKTGSSIRIPVLFVHPQVVFFPDVFIFP